MDKLDDDVVEQALADTLTIVVTAEHIQRGVMGEPYSCPIARACQEAGFESSRVGRDYVRVYDGGTAYEFALPDKARNFIIAFDNYGRDGSSPFSFSVKRSSFHRI